MEHHVWTWRVRQNYVNLFRTFAPSFFSLCHVQEFWSADCHIILSHDKEETFSKHVEELNNLFGETFVICHAFNREQNMTVLCKGGHMFLYLFCAWCIRSSSGYFVTTEKQHRLNLNGKWKLTNSNESLAFPAEVPGCVHSALLKQGYIKVGWLEEFNSCLGLVVN